MLIMTSHENKNRNLNGRAGHSLRECYQRE
jgi:hypothetical protein